MASKIEYLILSTLVQDENNILAPLLVSNFKPELFLDTHIGTLFKHLKEYFVTYNKVPSITILENILSEKVRQNNEFQDLVEIIRKIEKLPIDFSKDYDYIYSNIDKHLRYVSLRHALLESSDLMEDREQYVNIEGILRDALIRTLTVDIGMDYWSCFKERIRRQNEERGHLFPTYMDEFDELLSGGPRAGTLSIFLGITHVGKSNFMLNIAKRALLNSHKVVYVTLEMSEEMTSQRIDSGISGMDINKMYHDDNVSTLQEELESYKTSGQLLVKSFPTYTLDFLGLKAYLNEIKSHGFGEDIYLIIDSLNLMKYIGNKNDSDFSGLKSLTAQIKGLTLERNIPIISCTHLNRGAYFKPFQKVGMGDIGLCLAIGELSDVICLLGKDESDALYKSEFLVKILKNRLGGQVGEILKMYMNPKSLSIYTGQELTRFIKSLDKVGLTKDEIKTKI